MPRVKEFDPRLRGEMLGLGGRAFNTESWADLRRRGHHIHIIEDEDGAAAVMTYSLPYLPVVIGETLWIRADLRGTTDLFDVIVQEVMDETGRNIALAQASPQTVNRYRELYDELRDGVFIHVRE